MKSKNYNKLNLLVLSLLTLMLSVSSARAEDGYRLWLRYEALSGQSATAYRATLKSFNVAGNSATSAAIRAELETGLSGLLGKNFSQTEKIENVTLIIGTP
jgi:alpha-glucuronidase